MIKVEKKQLRMAVKKAIAEMSAEEKQRQSKAICEKVASLAHYRAATAGSLAVLLFHSMADEPYTHGLIRELHSAGVKVYLPKIAQELEVRLYNGPASLKEGPFGILEPCGPLQKDLQEIDLAFIPGLAFTSEGARLGRGKGYYDRLLPKLSCPCFGLCFSCQFVPSIPTETHDIPLSGVISGAEECK